MPVVSIYGLEDARPSADLGPRYTLADYGGAPFECTGATLGECLDQLQRHFNATIAPYDGTSEGLPFEDGEEPKYWWYASPTYRFSPMLVDVHIHRDGVEICPKQNIAFEMREGDIVTLGILVC